MDGDLFDESSGVFESGQFIVLTSQVDSQPTPALDLPALQPVGEESQDSEIVYPMMDESPGHQPDSLVLVMDSEAETTEKPGETTSDAVVIGETSEENTDRGRGGGGGGGGGTSNSNSSSEENGNVTVIPMPLQKEEEEEEDEEEDDDDDDEEEDSQDEPMSQDLFAAAKEVGESRPVSTPSVHLANLQLSGQPMLVPETLEDSPGDQEICPSPDAYDGMPHIIPSTPSLTSEGGEPEYNPEEAQTLNSQPGKAPRKPSSESQSLSGSQKQSASARASASQAGAVGMLMMAGSTLAGDLPEWQQSQSLCLQLTSSSSASRNPSQRLIGQSQQRTDSQAASQSEGGRNSDLFSLSPNQRRGPAQSQRSPQQASESVSPSMKGSVSPSQPKMEKAEVENICPGSREGSSNDTPTSWGAPPKGPISIDMVHSQSQSASETTFKLESGLTAPYGRFWGG